jgi:drug/metabolite transporter (DMT)-like permease
MIYLLLSIICATSLVVVLKMFVRWRVPQFYGIVYNYLFCAIAGWALTEELPSVNTLQEWPGLLPSLALGALFFLVFNLIAISAKYLGIGITSIAFKLSFVIPALAAILLYQEPLSIQTISAISLAFLAVIAISKKDKNSSLPEEKLPQWVPVLPGLIFAGAGSNDAIFNFLQVNYLKPGFDHILTASIFSGAFLAGFLAASYRRDFWNWRYLFAGVMLGIPNYASLYFLLQALESDILSYSLLFPAYNIGIILCGVGIGLVLFGERLNTFARLGLSLAVMALAVVIWGGR